MNYKVCILAAGVGSRMGELSQHVNKAILPVNYKATLTHIIEKFSPKVEIVIAVGHKKQTVTDYLSVAHPERKITFVEIKEYVGPGTGPGYSLLQCKKHLNCPFIFFAADTIVLEDIPAPDKNWFGIATVKNPEKFCTVKIKNNLVCQIDDKIKTSNKFAFIGLAGIYNHEHFFLALEKNRDIIAGEIQVSNGFKSLLEKQLVPIGFTWFDTGTFEKYVSTSKSLAGENYGFDFSKGDEFLYFVGDKVIKYFANKDIVEKRCARAKILEGLVPRIEQQKNHFYGYQKIDGQTLYSILNNKLLNTFLYWADTYLWKKQTLNEKELSSFKDTCRKFYYDKTMKRLEMFYEKTGIYDTTHEINGVNIPSLKEMFAKIDWEYIYSGIPATIHGDLQFDNVLVTEDNTDLSKQFLLLDWRQDFGGSVETGDLYYDLAKMYGGMTLSYKLIKEGKFSFDLSDTNAFYKFDIQSDLIEAREEYENIIKKRGYDIKKIKLLTSLIFLNMSPLHNDPFDYLLYFLGKNMLYKVLLSISEENFEEKLNYNESLVDQKDQKATK